MIRLDRGRQRLAFLQRAQSRLLRIRRTMLAAVCVYARSAWIGIGLHCAWDFLDGGVFGACAINFSLLFVNIHGPEWLTGGRDGLDASLVTIMICLSAAVVFLLLAWRRGLWLAPFWKRTELSG